MKNALSKLVFLLLILNYQSFAQDGKFTFTLASSANTSAGVFKNDSILVKTLWNSERYGPGTYTRTWDGTDDWGKKLIQKDATYKIKVLSNNVQYTWQGTVGNTSDSMTGSKKHRGYYNCMQGLAFSSSYGYFCTGYSEGVPSRGKFLLTKPNIKIIFSISKFDNVSIDLVATDGTKVYWAARDANSTNNTFVFASNTSDDADVAFSSGVAYTSAFGKSYNTISKTNLANSSITGLAVQRSGQYLFVARAGLNQIQVLDKTTGLLVKTITLQSPKGLSLDSSNNLWIISATNTVAMYAINEDGTLTSPKLTLQGLIDPLGIGYGNSMIAVADGGASQQVKFFNSTTAAAVAILGTAGGYSREAMVDNNKFYFSDKKGNKLPFVAFQPDNSFWVNDPGNFRVQHYSASMTYVNRIMSLGASYNTWADRKSINRVFANFLEFKVDYSQPLSGSTGWTLVNNWGANVTQNYNVEGLKFCITLKNGRTYGTMRRNEGREIVELMPGGTMRFTGILTLNNTTKILCDDGSIQESAFAVVDNKPTYIYKRYALTGFDGYNNPIWSTTPEILATATGDNLVGNPASYAQNQILSSRNKVVLFYINAQAQFSPLIYHKGYHLGLMQKGATESYLFQTEKSTSRDYAGPYPPAGFFDVGNNVEYGGGNVNILERNIITSYHGEFWKGTQTNKFNHYYDNGLAVGQFGTTRPEASLIGQSVAGMAGNALTPFLLKDSATGDLYLYHGDESDHAGIHRWKISGLNTIAEQVITIPYPSAYTVPVTNYTDLMAGLPFNNTLDNNTAGWTRSPTKDTVNWEVKTSKQTYNVLTSNDVTIKTTLRASGTNMVNRDLGTNNVTTNWKIAGELSFPTSNLNNYYWWKMYLEVLDANGKVLTSFFPQVNSTSTTTSLYANTVAFGTTSGTYLSSVFNLVPFEVKIVSGVVTFTYGSYTPIVTTILDGTANWRTPKTLRMRFINSNPTGTQRDQSITVKDFKFYKDYLSPVPNRVPSVNAGADQIITLPVNSTTLAGTATDPDGIILSYSWLKISGPSEGVIATSNLAASVVNNLVQGIYKFELSVKDNAGAISKDTVQVTVNAAAIANVPPPLDLLPAVNPSNTVNGLDYKYYEGSWSMLPAFGSLTPVKTGTANDFNLSLAGRAENYGISFTGFINVPFDGQYTFYTTSDDGSSLYIDGKLTVSNDGVHYTQEKFGTVGLKAGKHSITGLFFQQAGGQIFIVSYAGMGIPKQAIPNSSLFRVNILPGARAGATQTTTTKKTIIILEGSATDTDGIIKSYHWRKISGPENGQIVAPDAATTPISNLTLGIYKYQLTVADNAGGKATDTLLLLVTEAQSGKEPALLLTKTGLKTYTFFQTTNQLSVFPNPTSNIAYLDIKAVNKNDHFIISVYNFAGVQVRFTPTPIPRGKTQLKLDLTGLPKGVYTIITKFDDGQIITNKILKGN